MACSLLSFCFSAAEASTCVATPGVCLARTRAQMPSSGMLFPGLIYRTVAVCLAGFPHAPGWPHIWLPKLLKQLPTGLVQDQCGLLCQPSECCDLSIFHSQNVKKKEKKKSVFQNKILELCSFGYFGFDSFLELLFQVIFFGGRRENATFFFNCQNIQRKLQMYKFCLHFLSRPQIYQVPFLICSQLNGRVLLLSAFLQDCVSLIFLSWQQGKASLCF